jgi:SsrA-binding protein
MKIINKKAKFYYELFDRFEAGIELLGGEVKAVRLGKADLSNAFAKVIEDEVFLVNTNIPIAGKKDYDSTRTRRLLLHKDEIISIKTKLKTKKLTLVPTKMYTKSRLIKAEIALAKTKRKFEKKEAIKRKDIERELQEALKSEARSTKF